MSYKLFLILFVPYAISHQPYAISQYALRFAPHHSIGPFRWTRQKNAASSGCAYGSDGTGADTGTAAVAGVEV
jgi:hypothetical protein